MSITHTQQIVGQDNLSRQVSKNAWNAAHTVVGLLVPAGTCQIKTGTYTGDGTVSQTITGVGFAAKFLVVFGHAATGGDTNYSSYWKNDLTEDDIGQRVDIETWHNNRLTTINADGFIVNDDGTDEHPNKNTVVYDYTVWGAF